MEKLHPDIKLSILLRLSVESIYHCKLVCKPWRDLLRDTKVGLLFGIGKEDHWYGGDVELYYGGQYDEIDINDDEHDHSYKTQLTKMDHPLITDRALFDVMLGSCNGLVCFFVRHHKINDPVYICNPITGEYLHLPRFTACETHVSSGSIMTSGFGYLHSTNEYKVVRIYYNFNQPSLVGRVQVYTLGGGSGWRNKGDITYYLSSSGVFANGSVYWIDNGWKIVAFDLADEEFRLLPPPPCFHSRNHIDLSLWSLGGCLCVIVGVLGDDGGKCVDIWALKNKKKIGSYNMKDQEYHSCGWSREFSIPWEGPAHYWPLALTKSSEVLLWHNDILCCYDPKTATLKKIWNDDTRFRHTEAIPHMNSLVSLKVLGEKSERRK